MQIECEYQCLFHRGKIDWHHPISNKDIGMYLCEAHHSLIMGRKKRYDGEMIFDKTIEEMRTEVKEFEKQKVVDQGGNPVEIDKH